jgi:hypothetical protein
VYDGDVANHQPTMDMWLIKLMVEIQPIIILQWTSTDLEHAAKTHQPASYGGNVSSHMDSYDAICYLKPIVDSWNIGILPLMKITVEIPST